MQLPMVALCILRWRQRRPLTVAETSALALTCLSVLHAAALGYSRGGGESQLLPAIARYQEPLLLGASAQLFAALRLAECHRLGRGVLIGWIAFTLFGLIKLSELHLTAGLPAKAAMDRLHFQEIRRLLGDPITVDSALAGRLPPVHPDMNVVRRVLQDPVLKPRLPGVLKTPLPDDSLQRPWIFHHALPLTLLATALFLLFLVVSCRMALKAGNRERSHASDG